MRRNRPGSKEFVGNGWYGLIRAGNHSTYGEALRTKSEDENSVWAKFQEKPDEGTDPRIPSTPWNPFDWKQSINDHDRWRCHRTHNFRNAYRLIFNFEPRTKSYHVEVFRACEMNRF